MITVLYATITPLCMYVCNREGGERVGDRQPTNLSDCHHNAASSPRVPTDSSLRALEALKNASLRALKALTDSSLRALQGYPWKHTLVLLTFVS